MVLGNIPKGQHIIVSPTRIESMMTAVHYVSIERNLSVTLHYISGEEETAKPSKDELEKIEGFLGIVSMVQSKRLNVG